MPLYRKAVRAVSLAFQRSRRRAARCGLTPPTPSPPKPVATFRAEAAQRSVLPDSFKAAGSDPVRRASAPPRQGYWKREKTPRTAGFVKPTHALIRIFSGRSKEAAEAALELSPKLHCELTSCLNSSATSAEGSKRSRTQLF